MSVPPSSPMGRYIIRALRKLFIYWPARKEVRKKALFGYDWPSGEEVYSCKKCDRLFKRKETHVDHVTPVVDPKEGIVSWDSYIDRLFSPVDNLVVLCKGCHSAKTKEENKTRRETKQRNNIVNKAGVGRRSKRANNKSKADRKK